jgi:hypothetical protein
LFGEAELENGKGVPRNDSGQNISLTSKRSDLWTMTKAPSNNALHNQVAPDSPQSSKDRAHDPADQKLESLK